MDQSQTSNASMNQTETSTTAPEPVPITRLKMAVAILAAILPYLTVSYPPFQAIDFSTMNINHALHSSRVRPLESVLSNLSSRIHPLKSSTRSIISRLQSRSLICLQAQPHFSVPILWDTTRSAYPIWLSFPFTLRLSNAVVLVTYSTSAIHCL